MRVRAGVLGGRISPMVRGVVDRSLFQVLAVLGSVAVLATPACSASHAVEPCLEGTVTACRCPSAPGTAECRGDAFEPCACPEPCWPSDPPPTCACFDGAWGNRECGPDSMLTPCSCEVPALACAPHRSAACRCASGSRGEARCDDRGVLEPCVCAGDGPVPVDAGRPFDSATLDARDAAWPDGCTPLRCEDLLCGVHRAACGVAVDCGFCETSSWSMDILARDLAWDATRGLLYLSTASTDGPRGNSIVALDPVTREQVFDVYVGSEPGQIALSSDGSVLYVALEGADSIRQVDLESRTAGAELLLGVEPRSRAPRVVGDMAVVPAVPSRLVVSMRASSSGDYAGVAVLEDGVMLPEIFEGRSPIASAIELADPRTAYGYNRHNTGFDFSVLAIHSRGVTLTRTAPGLIEGFGIDIVYEGGLVFSTVGDVIDPVALRRVGRYSAAGPTASEAATNRTYVLDGTSDNLVAFDRATFIEISRVNAPRPPEAEPFHLVRWGPHGLAYLERVRWYEPTSARLVVITSELVAAPP